jgi:hypothetical protein
LHWASNLALELHQTIWLRSAAGGLFVKEKERWMQLCEQAAVEPDPERLLQLCLELDALLAEKETRLRSASAGAAEAAKS